MHSLTVYVLVTRSYSCQLFKLDSQLYAAVNGMVFTYLLVENVDVQRQGSNDIILHIQLRCQLFDLRIDGQRQNFTIYLRNYVGQLIVTPLEVLGLTQKCNAMLFTSSQL